MKRLQWTVKLFVRVLVSGVYYKKASNCPDVSSAYRTSRKSSRTVNRLWGWFSKAIKQFLLKILCCGCNAFCLRPTNVSSSLPVQNSEILSGSSCERHFCSFCMKTHEKRKKCAYSHLYRAVKTLRGRSCRNLSRYRIWHGTSSGCFAVSCSRLLYAESPACNLPVAIFRSWTEQRCRIKTRCKRTASGLLSIRFPLDINILTNAYKRREREGKEVSFSYIRWSVAVIATVWKRLRCHSLRVSLPLAAKFFKKTKLLLQLQKNNFVLPIRPSFNFVSLRNYRNQKIKSLRKWERTTFTREHMSEKWHVRLGYLTHFALHRTPCTFVYRPIQTGQRDSWIA